MKLARHRWQAWTLAAVSLGGIPASTARPDSAPEPIVENKFKEVGMQAMQLAKGAFEVRMKPVALDGPAEDPAFGRYTMTKTFTGDFAGEGGGQMLAAMGAVPGSGAYVAIERLTGKLAGRDGSFALFHRGVMSGGDQEMLIEIVPDSGTDALAGIRGRLRILIEGKAHFYELEYELPAAPPTPKTP